MHEVAAGDWNVLPEIRGYVWESERPRAQVLLQHGYAEYAERNVERYHTLIPRLVAAGYTVYAIDLRGHGRSPGSRFVTDARQAVEDHLAARRALDSDRLPLFLFGHSLGGLVTAASVSRDPSGVRGVILSSPLLVIHANAIERLGANILSRIAPRMKVRGLDSSDMSRIPEEVKLAQDDPMMGATAVNARVAATSFALIEESWKLFPDWKTPVLAIHGTADRVTDPEGTRRFIETVAASDKTLRMIDGGYHELLNDLDREKVMQIILGWIDERISNG